MLYRIQIYDGVAQEFKSVPPVEETKQRAEERAKELATPPNVTLVRVIRIETEDEENGAEVWSQERNS